MGFHIMFNEDERMARAAEWKKKRAKDIKNYQKGISAKTMPPPDPPRSDGTTFESVRQGWKGDAAKKGKSGLLRYRGK